MATSQFPSATEKLSSAEETSQSERTASTHIAFALGMIGCAVVLMAAVAGMGSSHRSAPIMAQNDIAAVQDLAVSDVTTQPAPDAHYFPLRFAAPSGSADGQVLTYEHH